MPSRDGFKEEKAGRNTLRNRSGRPAGPELIPAPDVVAPAVVPAASGALDGVQRADIVDDPGCGWPLPGYEIRIIDPATGTRLPAGQVGEICVRGYQVMKGYYKKPEETAKTIDAGGWLQDFV